MSKMQILLIIGAGILSFAGSFGISRLMKPEEAPGMISQAAAQPAASPVHAPSAADAPGGFLLTDDEDESAMSLSEKQLQNLIHEVRTRLQECRTKEKYLQEESERVEMAREGLREEIDRLNTLREKVATTVRQLERQEQELQASIVTVGALEKTNFQHLASTYDKMDSASAGRILLTMASGPQMHDAVKILYYMNERTAAKVIAEISTSRPEAAAMLCLQLKRVQESE